MTKNEPLQYTRDEINELVKDMLRAVRSILKKQNEQPLSKVDFEQLKIAIDVFQEAGKLKLATSVEKFLRQIRSQSLNITLKNTLLGNLELT